MPYALPVHVPRFRRSSAFRTVSCPAPARRGERASTVALGLAALNLALAGACTPPPQASRANPVTVTLLHTNDTHSRLEPAPLERELSATNPGPQRGGLARHKALIDALRASAPNVLLFDSGDRAQGTIFYNAWRGSAELMAANALGYDAIGLGNHEFDLGPEELGRALRGEPVSIAGVSYETEAPRAPVVATNVDASDEPALAGRFVRSVLLERGGERIGVVGAVTRETSAISKPGALVQFLDEVASVQAEVDRLALRGVDKIVLLSHCGYGVDVERAQRWSGVDVIVSAHDHALLGEPSLLDAAAPGQGALSQGPYPTVVADAEGSPTLVVSAGESGRWLGRLEVSFDALGVPVQWSGQPVFVRGCAFDGGTVDCAHAVAGEDAQLKDRIESYRAPVASFASEVIGEASVAFDGSRKPGLRTQEMPLGNLIADTMLVAAGASDGVVAAVTNGGGIRAGIEAGQVTFEEALAVLPFGNKLAAVEVTGAELLAALDYGLARPGEGPFPQVAGLQVVYCSAEPCPDALRPTGRVVSLRIAGAQVDLVASYRVAVNDFLASGGDGLLAFRDACRRPEGFCRDTGLLMLDLLVDEFRLRSPVGRSVQGRLVPR
jgi:2',3'-cyclic-nucleotide 2'-phosphodiesterase (5'-nucleotidase family)